MIMCESENLFLKSTEIGSLPLIDKILKKNKLPIHLINIALEIASMEGYIDIIQLLITHGADINYKNEFGDTPLMAATFNGHEEAACFLIDAGADIDQRDNLGNTALMRIAFNTLDIDIQYLIDYGVDLSLKNYLGFTALELARERKNINMASIILLNN